MPVPSARTRIRTFMRVFALWALSACSSGVDGLRPMQGAVQTDGGDASCSEDPPGCAMGATGGMGGSGGTLVDDSGAGGSGGAADGPMLLSGGGAGMNPDTGFPEAAPDGPPHEPGVVTLVPPDAGSLDGITAAAWGMNARRFYALDAGGKTFCAIDPASASVSEPIPISASGDIEPQAFAVSPDEIDPFLFVIAGGTLIRIRADGSGTTELPLPIGSDGGTGRWGLAHAGRWLLVMSPTNEIAALEDGTDAPTTVDALADTFFVGSDGVRFALVRPGFPSYGLHAVTPGDFTPHPAPCGFPATPGVIPAVFGDTVAWVTSAVSYQLTFATLTDSACSGVTNQSFGFVPAGQLLTALVGEDRALVVNDYVQGDPGLLDLAVRLRDGTVENEFLDVNVDGSELSFVVGASAYVLVVTGGEPVLIAL